LQRAERENPLIAGKKRVSGRWPCRNCWNPFKTLLADHLKSATARLRAIAQHGHAACAYSRALALLGTIIPTGRSHRPLPWNAL